MIVDAHAHVFLSRADDPQRTVDELAPGDLAAPLERLERHLSQAGVDAAVLVPLGPEDDYVLRAVRAQPARRAGIAVADDAVTDPGLVAERLATGFSGLRMFGLPGVLADEPPWLPIVRRLTADGKILWLYPRAEHLATVDALASRLPELAIVLNHCGLTHTGIGRDASGRPRIDSPVPQPHEGQVLALARHPRVFIMVSGAYAFSHGPYPYRDVGDVVARLADAFGPERLVWASDFPWIVDDPGYGPCLALVDHHLPGLSADERAGVLGGNIRRILAWEPS